MHSLLHEIAAFQGRKTQEVSEARRRAALRLSCGIDLSDLVGAEAGTLMRALVRIKRAMQRERMKALRKHWSYDLNRHIALKQARDEVRRSLGLPEGERLADGAANENGARRRRHASSRSRA